jgi:hypothetical protein
VAVEIGSGRIKKKGRRIECMSGRRELTPTSLRMTTRGLRPLRSLSKIDYLDTWVQPVRHVQWHAPWKHPHPSPLVAVSRLQPELQDIYMQLQSECRIISINYFLNQNAYYRGRRYLDEPILLWQLSGHTENKGT